MVSFLFYKKNCACHAILSKINSPFQIQFIHYHNLKLIFSMIFSLATFQCQINEGP